MPDMSPAQQALSLIASEMDLQKSLENQLKSSKARVQAIRRAYKLEDPDSESSRVKLPSRMKPANKQLLAWIAAATGGRALQELEDYCRTQNVMSSEALRTFLGNYRGSRYRLLQTDADGSISITTEGRQYLEAIAKNIHSSTTEDEGGPKEEASN